MHQIHLPEWAVARGRRLRPPVVPVPARTALLVIDMQHFFMSPGQPMANPHALDIGGNVNAIGCACRRAGAMIVFTQHSFADRPGAAPAIAAAGAQLMSTLHDEMVPGSAGFDLHPDLQIEPTDIHVVKHTGSPLHPRSGCDLLGRLEDREIETLIITGVVTNGCCLATAVDAYQHRFKILVAADATAAMTDAEHNAALLDLAITFADVRTTSEIVGLISS